MTTPLTVQAARLAWDSLWLAVHDHLAIRHPAGGLPDLLTLSMQTVLCARVLMK